MISFYISVPQAVMLSALMFGDFVSIERQKKSETETLGEGVV
jgi:hypothetical protein